MSTTNPTPKERAMGYNPPADDQWTTDDLARAEAAQDYAAINAARHAGHLRDILNPPREVSDDDRLAAVLGTPAGPTVPGQQPGGTTTGTSPAPRMEQDEVDRLAAAGDYAAINKARREGRLRHLGVS